LNGAGREQMDGGGDAPESSGHGPQVVTDGEFAGWLTWRGSDPFEDQSGPYYFREEPDGSVLCAFRAERKHMNGGGFMHGGCLLTFADFCLFGIAYRELKDHRSVTVSLNGEFLGPSTEGELIECRGEVVRNGGLVFLRGLVSTSDRPLLNFSGVVKKLKAR
jgi:acyl-coenzyme A thioesterase PaaI-like protein